jgi:Tfp pilus assembly protein PilN
MIRINFLPPEQRPPKWRTGKIFAVLTLLVVFAFAAVWGGFLSMIDHTERSLADAKNRFELLRPAREAMLAANARQQGIDAKNAVLMTLTNTRPSWYAILSQLGAKTPAEIWLTDLTVEKNVVKLGGMAKDYPDLAAFMRTLDQDELFAEPVLGKAEKLATVAVIKFEMTVKVKGL